MPKGLSRDLVRSEGQKMCSLDKDEADTLFDSCHHYVRGSSPIRICWMSPAGSAHIFPTGAYSQKTKL